jgi:hypothetical protein
MKLDKMDKIIIMIILAFCFFAFLLAHIIACSCKSWELRLDKRDEAHEIHKSMRPKHWDHPDYKRYPPR